MLGVKTMDDDPKIIKLEHFQKSNGVLSMQMITTVEMFQLEINELQKNLYAAYDRITELKEEIRKLESTKTNKE